MKKRWWIAFFCLLIIAAHPFKGQAAKTIENDLAAISPLADSELKTSISVPFNTEGGYYSSQPSGTDVTKIQNSIAAQEDLFAQLQAVTKSIELSTVVAANGDKTVVITLDGTIDFSSYLATNESLATFYLNIGAPSYLTNQKVNASTYPSGTKKLTFSNQAVTVSLPGTKSGVPVEQYQIVYDFFTSSTNHAKFKTILFSLSAITKASISTKETTLVKGSNWSMDQSIVNYTDAAGNTFDTTTTGTNSYASNITVSNPPDTSNIGTYTVNYKYTDVFKNVITATSIVNVISPTVVVKYVDTDNNEISTEDTYTGEVGDAYTTSPKNIDGYTLSEVIGEPSGTFGGEEIYVTYVYEKNKYTIDFDTNGGSEVPSQEILYNDKGVTPANPTYDGKVFKGWYTDENLTTQYNFDNPVVSNITLYANWQSGMYLPDDTVVPSENSTNELRIQHVPDFDFGTTENTNNKTNITSELDPFNGKDLVQFLSVIDDRTTSNTSTWRLTAKRTEFTTSDNAYSLDNSKLLLGDITVINDVDNSLSLGNNTQLSLPADEETLICKSTKKIPFSSYSIVFGTGNISGAELEIPSGFVKTVNSQYTSTIDWNLTTGDISG